MTSEKFQAVLDHARPDQWFLRCTPLTEGAEMRDIDWPENKGTDLAEYLEQAGLWPGRYTVEAERIDRGQDPTSIKQAKGRLRKHGPLSTVVEVGTLNGIGSSPAPSSASRSRTTRSGPVTGLSAFASVDADPSIEAEVKAARLAAAKAQRVRAEWELEKTERERRTFMQPNGDGASAELAFMRGEIERLRREQSNPPHALIAALAPVVQALIQTLVDSSTKRDELMLAIFGGRGEASEQPASPNALDTVTGALPLLRQLVELGKELGGGGGGGEGGMLSDVAQIITALNGTGVAPGLLPQPTPPAAGQPARGPVQPQQRIPTAEESMRLNVMKWLASVQEFAAIGAEPVAVAEELYRPLEMLPREFRAMILGNNLDAIMGSLVRWMPRPFYDKLTATMSHDPAQKAWIAEFIRALQEQADEPEPPQPVGPGAAHDDRAADIAQGAGPSIFEPVESPFGPPTPSPFGPSPFDAPATPQPTKPGDTPPPTL